MITGTSGVWKYKLLLFPLDIIAVRQSRQLFFCKIVFHAFIVYLVIRLEKSNIRISCITISPAYPAMPYVPAFDVFQLI